MRMLNVVCAAAFIPLAGCAVSGGNDATGARLPAGVTLLESDQDRCAGVVHVDESSTSTSREIVVRQGQNAAFRVDGDDAVRWTCIGDQTASEDRVVCPDETSYVRITRPAASEEFLVECFG